MRTLENGPASPRTRTVPSSGSSLAQPMVAFASGPSGVTVYSIDDRCMPAGRSKGTSSSILDSIGQRSSTGTFLQDTSTTNEPRTSWLEGALDGPEPPLLGVLEGAEPPLFDVLDGPEPPLFDVLDVVAPPALGALPTWFFIIVLGGGAALESSSSVPEAHETRHAAKQSERVSFKVMGSHGAKPGPGGAGHCVRSRASAPSTAARRRGDHRCAHLGRRQGGSRETLCRRAGGAEKEPWAMLRTQVRGGKGACSVFVGAVLCFAAWGCTSSGAVTSTATSGGGGGGSSTGKSSTHASSTAASTGTGAGTGTGGDDGGVEAGPPDIQPGMPITAPDGVWTDVPFPEAYCRDGTPAHLMVHLNSASKKFAIYLEGGGACFNDASCKLLTIDLPSYVLGGGIFNFTRTDNPIGDWNIFYVPYCTGDVHAGDTRPGNPGPLTGPQNFTGYSNLKLYL